MSRTLGLVILFGIILLAWFGLSQYQKSYKILPAKLPEKLAVSPTQEWKEFIPRNKKFKVLLPTLPQHATEEQKERSYEMFVSEENNGTLYMISFIEFKVPIDAKHHQVVLNSIMEDLLNSSQNNELKSSNTDLFEGREALEFDIENKDVAIFGKAFLDEQTLVVLTRISKQAFKNKKEFDYFINSFHLLPVKNQKIGVKSE
jgi:hypothetical protein